MQGKPNNPTNQPIFIIIVLITTKYSDAQYERYCERNFTRRPLTLYIITIFILSKYFSSLFYATASNAAAAATQKKKKYMTHYQLFLFSFIPRRACISCLLFVCWLWWQSQGERELKLQTYSITLMPQFFTFCVYSPPHSY